MQLRSILMSFPGTVCKTWRSVSFDRRYLGRRTTFVSNTATVAHWCRYSRSLFFLVLLLSHKGRFLVVHLVVAVQAPVCRRWSCFWWIGIDWCTQTWTSFGTFSYSFPLPIKLNRNLPLYYNFIYKSFSTFLFNLFFGLDNSKN